VRWQRHGRRPVYESDWVNVWLDDVEIPGVGRIEHHVLTMPRPSTTAVVTDDDGRILLMWRHRFITDEWGWEVPAGWADPGEEPAEAIRREIEEETGWRPAEVSELIGYNALSGISTMRFTAYHAIGSTFTGPPTDPSESTHTEWFTPAEVAKLIADGQVPDGPSLTALSFYLATQVRPGESR
jgi:8-oxo-dGTP pyrophosphatase MutT (NUDIX family)